MWKKQCKVIVPYYQEWAHTHIKPLQGSAWGVSHVFKHVLYNWSALLLYFSWLCDFDRESWLLEPGWPLHVYLLFKNVPTKWFGELKMYSDCGCQWESLVINLSLSLEEFDIFGLFIVYNVMHFVDVYFRRHSYLCKQLHFITPASRRVQMNPATLAPLLFSIDKIFPFLASSSLPYSVLPFQEGWAEWSAWRGSIFVSCSSWSS